MIASPPTVLRETCMVEMFTPASPSTVPTRPIMPGTSRCWVISIAPTGVASIS